MAKEKVEKPFNPKGKYVVWIEDEGDGTKTVYSTDSVFWRDFFTKTKEEL